LKENDVKESKHYKVRGCKFHQVEFPEDVLLNSNVKNVVYCIVSQNPNLMSNKPNDFTFEIHVNKHHHDAGYVTSRFSQAVVVYVL